MIPHPCLERTNHWSIPKWPIQKVQGLVSQQTFNGKSIYDKYSENHSMPCCAASSIAFLSLSLLQSLRSANPWTWSSYNYPKTSARIYHNKFQPENGPTYPNLMRYLRLLRHQILNIPNGPLIQKRIFCPQRQTQRL